MSSQIRWLSMLEDNPLTVMDRVKGEAGALITQASISSIKFRVFQYRTADDLIADYSGTEVLTEATISKATSVFDTLQVDALWTESGGDSQGYNVRITIPSARFPDAAKVSRVEITFTPTTGEPFKIVWAVNTTAVAST